MLELGPYAIIKSQGTTINEITNGDDITRQIDQHSSGILIDRDTLHMRDNISGSEIYFNTSDGSLNINMVKGK